MMKEELRRTARERSDQARAAAAPKINIDDRMPLESPLIAFTTAKVKPSSQQSTVLNAPDIAYRQ